MAATCRSCGAPIVWARTPAGKRTPLDAKPEKRVVIVVGDVDAEGLEREGGAGTIVDGIIGCSGCADREDARAIVVDAYVSHFATCPDAERFRQ